MELYAGIRQDAGYEVCDTVAQAHQLVHLACWTHCRRYFIEALQACTKDQRGPNQLAAWLADQLVPEDARCFLPSG